MSFKENKKKHHPSPRWRHRLCKTVSNRNNFKKLTTNEEFQCIKHLRQTYTWLIIPNFFACISKARHSLEWISLLKLASKQMTTCVKSSKAIHSVWTISFFPAKNIIWNCNKQNAQAFRFILIKISFFLTSLNCFIIIMVLNLSNS